MASWQGYTDITSRTNLSHNRLEAIENGKELLGYKLAPNIHTIAAKNPTNSSHNRL